jgi:hypothetical protein
LTPEALLHVAKARMYRFFAVHPTPVFTHQQLVQIVVEQQESWRLAGVSVRTILDFLLEHTKLKKLGFPFPRSPETRYVWGTVALHRIVATLKPAGYLSHHSALHIHKLTTRAPTAMYLNVEQLAREQYGTLSQRGIDLAFRRTPRTTSSIARVGSEQVYLLNGKQTGDLGVDTGMFSYGGDDLMQLRVTNLHRTLIDAVVRPVYCGGIEEVLNAYKLARDRTSIPELLSILGKLDHLYPYHQAIGFCLQHADHPQKALTPLRRRRKTFDFYLTHHKGQFTYVKDWRLHIPSDLATAG